MSLRGRNAGIIRELRPRSRSNCTGEDAPPSRVSTAEISVGGFYIETMFTLDVGTRVFLTLWLKEQAVRTTAIVATRHPQVGNGFQFIDISPEDRPKLNEFISGLETR